MLQAPERWRWKTVSLQRKLLPQNWTKRRKPDTKLDLMTASWSRCLKIAETLPETSPRMVADSGEDVGIPPHRVPRVQRSSHKGRPAQAVSHGRPSEPRQGCFSPPMAENEFVLFFKDHCVSIRVILVLRQLRVVSEPSRRHRPPETIN